MATATLKQIAERTGLSIRTVSRIIGDGGTGVGAQRHSSSTRGLVLSAARELGYRPNAFAKAVRTGRFGCIAILLSSSTPHRSTLPGTLYEGIDDALAEHNLHLTLARVSDEKLKSEEAVPKILREWMADGLLVNYNYDIPASFLQTINDTRIPSVWINTKQEVNAVWPDDFAAGRSATGQLLALGHRRIAYAINENAEGHYSATDRRNGYEAAMLAAGLSPQILRFPTPNVPGARTTVVPPEEWAEGSPIWGPEAAGTRPTAIVAYMPYIANYFVFLAASHGLQAPRDFSIMTFSEQRADEAGVLVTSWRIPVYAVGQEAVRMLLARLSSAGHEPQPPVVVPFTRPESDASVGPPPASSA
ncbi:MAG: LacI family DNA-binding transcriptional regulator [Akkermansiaceae bacterium]|nr:LacI family DNA-binding transcriptional regulator [Armatimonadota bacterium]